MFCSNLGIVTEEKQRSEKDRLLRNKYMGVLRPTRLHFQDVWL